MQERHTRESAIRRLNQLGAELSEENSTDKKKFYLSHATGYWIEVTSLAGGGYMFDFFQECPCTRK